MTVPSFQRKPLSCKCGHEWIGYIPIGIEVNLFIAHVKALTCPSCGAGSKKIGFGHSPKQTPVDSDKSIDERYEKWRDSTDTGLSSLCLAKQMRRGFVPEDERRYPYDPDDLGRCLRLLRIVPEWTLRIGEMAACGPVWAAMAARWAEMEESMVGEVGIFWEKGKSAPLTYTLMQQIEKDAK